MRWSLFLYFVVLFIATQAVKKEMDSQDEEEEFEDNEQIMISCDKCEEEMDDPVCARLASGDELQREVFVNLCQLESFNCKHKTDYTVVRTGKCYEEFEYKFVISTQ